MATIKVKCGINNPKCSPSRVFEIERLDFENTTSQPQNIETDVKLMYIIGQCKAVINDVYRNVAGINIVDNAAFYRVLDITKIVKHIEGFRPFNMPLDFVREINNCLYKTDNERAFAPQQWAKVVATANKTMLLAKEMLSNIFSEGISTVYDGNNKLNIIPSKAVIKLLGVSHDELKYGISLHCDGEEVIIMSQEYENILLELKELCGFDKVENDDDTEIKIFSNAVGVIAAFME